MAEKFILDNHHAALFKVEVQQGLPKWSYILLFISVLLLLGASGNMLALFGYNYAGEGGNALEKIHPSTLTLILALLAFLAYPQGEEKISYSIFKLGVFPYLFVSCISIVYTQAILGLPVSGLIVSWFTPGLLLVLLLQVNSKQIKYLAYLMHGLLLINTIMAIFEYKVGAPLIPAILIDYTGSGEILDMRDWGEMRALGLFGHPLASTLICSLYIVACFSLICFKNASRLQIFTMLHCLLALPLFGGRTSIAMALVFVGLMCLVRFWLELVGKGTNYFNVIKIKIAITVAVLALIVAFQMGMFDQLIDRIEYDNGSGYTRVLAMQILADVSNMELFLGDIHRTLAARQVAYGTIYGIEIFWVGMVLTYGLILSFVLFYFTFKMLVLIIKKYGLISCWSIVFFFVSTSSGVGLVAKSVTFSLLIVVLFCVYHSDEYDKNYW
ncbi:VpsF family polysaccharide biosynthesis protein [Iodobacter fluviatilis]|uniref:Lipid A core - O-antigen ligase and related enzymes n=1 Tax=Iodobacter fluviatilis TaxID=537 RepID=A0A377Q5P8_9NEIS|nr:VpsF family polysaccharide biosynthesis protein [Iodobacter fluviatilis]TCU81501.1 hypothetical protein EV682_12116 [Iodobacter fluviatilis]STQ89929.1 Uncharacterised protein [Iodobacter fluviatilis]